jgi:hypothetical protein
MGRITIFNIIGFVILGSIGAVVVALFSKEPFYTGLIFWGIVGFVFPRYPVGVVVWTIERIPWLSRSTLERKSIEQLRSMLSEQDSRIPIDVLLELGSRGQDLAQELPLVLHRLCSPRHEVRASAWHALQVVYPAQAKLLNDYRVEAPLEQSRLIVDRLRSAEPNTSPNDSPVAPVDISSGMKGPPSLS